VLDIGRAALQHPDAKPYIHDLLLSMALAEVRHISKEVRNLYHLFVAALLCLLVLSRCFLEVCNCKDWFREEQGVPRI
jgi:hypothetical protein